MKTILALIGLGWGFIAAPALAQAPLGIKGYTLEPIAKDVYGLFGPLGRSLIITTSEGTIYIDPLSVEAAKRGQEELKKLGAKPVKIVIYSHQHWDHIFGAQVFKDAGAEIIAHKECIKYFQRRPHPDLVMPDRTVSGGEVITLGGKAVELKYFGVNHGDCLLVPWVRDINMPFIVDLLTPSTAPIGMLPDYDPGEWVRTLKELEALPFDTWISGHAAVTAPKSDITERRQLLEDVLRIVGRERGTGKSREEIASMLMTELPQYAHLRNWGRDMPTLVERFSYYYGMGW